MRETVSACLRAAGAECASVGCAELGLEFWRERSFDLVVAMYGRLRMLAVLLAGRLGRRGRRCASAQLAAIPSRVSLCTVFAEVTRGSGRGGGGRGSGCSLWVLGFTLIKPNTMRFRGEVFSRAKGSHRRFP